MGFLLDLGYVLILVVSAPWLIYRRIIAGERLRFAARLGLGLEPSARPPIWLHGASVGEISVLAPLIARLEQTMPGTPLVISAYSPTGFEAARRAYPRHRVVLFPLDFSFVVERVLRRLDPRVIVIIEGDLWPNFLRAAERRSVPVAILNGKMSERSFRLHARTRIVARLLRRLPLIAVQSEEHAERLRFLGVSPERIRVTGNMKYDLTQPLDEARELGRDWRRHCGYESDDAVIVGGSLHEREDQLLIEAFASLGAGNRALVLVPRYPSDAARVARLTRACGFEPVMKSALDRGAAAPRGRHAVLVVDTVGELRRLYAMADVALVGGSLFYRAANKGGHNLMEPAILGVPVLFGPHNYSFRETAAELVASGGGMLVHDKAELAATLTTLLADRAARARMGERAREVVLRGQGATSRNCALLQTLLETEARTLPVTPRPTHNAARER
jgi:3-deoxy-D-manno-octulosonic-acid transferase